MTKTEEKVWEYLSTHKTPVTAGTLAKRFLCSHSHIGRVLREFEAQGKLHVSFVGKHKLYRAK
jgi:MarR-like DNA-binding transcriptional regulator SgrR of sgrS sRNA